MTRRLVLTKSARVDLQEIDSWIAAYNIEAADALQARLKQIFALLARHPEAGRRRADLSPELRSFPVGNYVLYYKLLDRRVNVLRILHGKRDAHRILKQGGS